MFYDESLDYIRKVGGGGSRYGLERTRKLLDRLGAPDSGMKIVHVAGTNGKGSVCAMLSSVLTAAGYKTGVYNSPAVLCYNEHFLIDGKALTDDKVACCMSRVRTASEGEEDVPTAFEQETALALLAFNEEKCDVCVLEAGLGGASDATNAVREKTLAVITKIGLDHCALLGNTLAEIAAQKAGIIKGDAVTCPQEDGAAGVLYPLCRVCKEAKLSERTTAGQKFVIDGKEYATGLLGDHQLVNAALVVEAVEALRGKGFDISDEALHKGLKNAVWHARFEVLTTENVAQSPYDIAIPCGKTVVLDGAHNPQGAAALADTLRALFAGRRIAAVTGVLADKDYAGVMCAVLPLASRVFVLTPPSARALDAEVLEECCKAVTDAPVSVCGGVKEGVRAALNTDCDVCVVFGSLTLFEEIAEKADCVR